MEKSEHAQSDPHGDENKKPAKKFNLGAFLLSLVLKVKDFLKHSEKVLSQKNDNEKDSENPSPPKKVWKDFPLLLGGLLSRDRPTRRMSVLFFVALFGIVVVPVISLNRWLHKRDITAKKQAQSFKEHIRKIEEKQSQFEKQNDSIVSLGTFVVELKEVPPEEQNGRTTNLAELEIVLLCDGKETREFIASSLIQVRSRLTSYLNSVDRVELLSKDGKRRLREALKKCLNDWLPKGKVLELYTTKVTFS